MAGGIASFECPLGTFKATYPESSKGKAVKLYVRPEHMQLTKKAAAENSVAVTVTDVSFEGNFIAMHGVTDSGIQLAAELRNDGTGSAPEPGSRVNMSFDKDRAALLPDEEKARS